MASRLTPCPSCSARGVDVLPSCRPSGFEVDRGSAAPGVGPARIARSHHATRLPSMAAPRVPHRLRRRRCGGRRTNGGGLSPEGRCSARRRTRPCQVRRAHRRRRHGGEHRRGHRLVSHVTAADGTPVRHFSHLRVRLRPRSELRHTAGVPRRRMVDHVRARRGRMRKDELRKLSGNLQRDHRGDTLQRLRNGVLFSRGPLLVRYRARGNAARMGL